MKCWIGQGNVLTEASIFSMAASDRQCHPTPSSTRPFRCADNGYLSSGEKSVLFRQHSLCKLPSAAWEFGHGPRISISPQPWLALAPGSPMNGAAPGFAYVARIVGGGPP